MRIGIISPLFPPDVAVPAAYVKELATRLSRTHTVHVLTYNHIPETIPHVTITSIEKQQRLPLRLYRFTKALWCLAHEVDILIVENGISTELPALMISFFCRTPLLLEISDPKVVTQNEHSVIKRTINRLLRRTAFTHADTFSVLPLTRPEIFSFKPYPTEALNAYETAWQSHLLRVNHYIPSHGNKP